ncbi:MAG: ATP-binding protein, partial [Planctomycetes bacterium]|nr:ATP-binding protein [Planctomycetota bacterium]
LVLPYWMLAFEEFEQLFIDGHNPEHTSAQRIVLRQALEKLKAPAAEELDLKWEFTIDTPVYYSLDQLRVFAENMNNARYVTNTSSYAFSRLPYRQLPQAEQEKMMLARRMEFNPSASEGETPHATFNGKLLSMLNALEARLNDRRYDFLLRPFEQARRNVDLADRFDADASPGALSRTVGWVIRQMLGQMPDRRNLTIVDLSGLPFEVVDTTVAVLTRALFDFNFWSPPDMRHPVLLVFEEAHNYLPRKPIHNRKTFARNAVEKVAKEGRKYGVSAMIVSQRPSEISETVLSQCNSMVLMRMNNPDDQEYAARVVSDQFRSLINLLPSMKPGEGFIIGDSVLMPMRTLIDMPPREPQSANMDFFGLWANGGRGSDVERIVDRWWRQERSAHSRTPRFKNADKSPFVPLDPSELALDSIDAPVETTPDLAAQTANAGAQEPGDAPPVSLAGRKLAELAALLGNKKPGNG